MDLLIRALEYCKQGKYYLFKIDEDQYMAVLKEKNIGSDGSRWFLEPCGFRLLKIKTEICYLVAFYNTSTGKINSGYLYYDGNISLGENWEQENYYWDKDALRVALPWDTCRGLISDC